QTTRGTAAAPISSLSLAGRERLMLLGVTTSLPDCPCSGSKFNQLLAKGAAPFASPHLSGRRIAMTMSRRIHCLATLVALSVCAVGSAGDKEPVETKVEQLEEAPAVRKAFYETAAKGPVQVQWVTFFRPGTNENLDSVAAGQWFDVEILLDRRAPA